MPRFLQKIVASALQVTGGTPGTGKVLTSDLYGNATWQDPAATSVTDGSLTSAKFSDADVAAYIKFNSEVFG